MEKIDVSHCILSHLRRFEKDILCITKLSYISEIYSFKNLIMRSDFNELE